MGSNTVEWYCPIIRSAKSHLLALFQSSYQYSVDSRYLAYASTISKSAVTYILPVSDPQPLSYRREIVLPHHGPSNPLWIRPKVFGRMRIRDVKDRVAA
jgi:hypothetical protein